MMNNYDQRTEEHALATDLENRLINLRQEYMEAISSANEVIARLTKQRNIYRRAMVRWYSRYMDLKTR